ncbi:hypothetical protein ABIB81_003683 [Bradyrhizobium sp. I1.7.5]
MALTVTDGLLIIATIAGPILAVQAQKWLERSREDDQRKKNIFYALMGTRATRLAEDHVRALNSIDLAFGTSRVKERAVIDAWGSYALQLNTPHDQTSEAQRVAWNSDAHRLFIELLFVMSKAVGFDFTKEHLQRGIYYPTGHAEIEADRHRVLKNAAAVLSGDQPLKMEISSFPVSNEMVSSQLALQGKLINAIGDAGLRVEIAAQPDPNAAD